MLTLTKIGNVVESATDSMPRYVGILQMSRRIIFFQETNQLGIDTGDYVTKFFDLSEVSIDGSIPANQSELDDLLEELFRMVTDGSGGGGSGDTISEVDLTLDEAETSVTDGSLSGKTIILLQREGVGYKKVVGTPGSRQFSVSGTTINFYEEGNPGGEDIHILCK